MCDKYLSCNKVDYNSSDKFSDNIPFNQYYNGMIGKSYSSTNRLILNNGYSVDYRYEILNNLGKGTFSNVYNCKDHKNNSLVALKVIKNELRFHESSTKEYKIYEKIKNNKCINIINLHRYFMFNNDIFFVFDIHGISLYNYYKNPDNNINLINLKDFSKQILNGLDYIHNLKIIHADLKPENILIKDNILKIIDLGSGFEEKENKYYDYIQSRWYRSPEVLFNQKITVKIDIWSYGCIIYELYYKKPLFTEKSSENMKSSILSLKNKFKIENYKIIENDINLNNFLVMCLQFNTFDRMNSFELLNHYYFTPLLI